MDRRNKNRLDLQLLCRIGPGGIVSEPVETLTENVSRDGMLVRWLEGVSLPTLGSALTVHVELPAHQGVSPRDMRFRTRVVRIVPATSGPASVGLKVEGVRFVKVAAAVFDLQAMPPATRRVI